ncbi:hypothetical protein [Streptomyces sp. NPDC046925]|uniref:hypothetical protein n=1 Tax=Streptomyces sp. NPDC046925 TaxID=3155375 RepID=UPI0033ECB4DE
MAVDPDDVYDLVEFVTPYYSKLKRYVENGNMARTLGTFGHSEMKAARDALSKTEMAVNPSGQLWSAVSHLESAHSAYQDVYSYDEYATLPAVVGALKGDVMACCLMASSYVYLREFELSKRAIREALEVTDEMRFGSQIGKLFEHPLKSWKQGVHAILTPSTFFMQGLTNYNESAVRNFKRELKQVRRELQS